MLLAFIQPEKPTQNAFCESFNAQVRDECLNIHWFVSLASARVEPERWRHDYNTDRTHSSLGDIPPAEFTENYRTKSQT